MHADSWSKIVQDRSNFAFLLLNHLIYFINFVLIFGPLTCKLSSMIFLFLDLLPDTVLAQKFALFRSEISHFSASTVIFKAVISTLFAIFLRPNWTLCFPRQNSRNCTVTMSLINEESCPQLKPRDGKRNHLEFAADSCGIPSPSRTSVGALRSIRDDAVQPVHKYICNKWLTISLHMPDKQDDASFWCRKAFSRCAGAQANTARARWLQLAAAHYKLDAARRSPFPSPSASADKPGHSRQV